MSYFEQWKMNLDKYLEGYLYDEKNIKRPTRFVYKKLKSILVQFADNELEEKIVLLMGMRGVGKTTLLAQLYFVEKYSNEHEKLKEIKNKIYITADDLFYNKLSLKEFIEYYEKFIGASILNLKEKTLILIDEIHYDPQWGMFLKRLYDISQGHKNLLVIASGSSALLLKTNADLTRRKHEEKIYPLSFIEYVELKSSYNEKNKIIFLSRELGEEIKKGIFLSDSAGEAYKTLLDLGREVTNIFSSIPDFQIEIERYIKSGAFPFSLNIKNNVIIHEKVNSIVNKIIEEDILKLRQFDAQTILRIHNLLYILASSTQVNLSKISSTLPLNVNTLRQVLDAFVKAEVLLKIPSYGTAHTQARKELKYLFVYPAIRNAILKGMTIASIEGALLEDQAAQLFYREFINNQEAQLFYDSSKNGADFIIKMRNGENYAVEVGRNKEETGQIYNTAKKIKIKFGIILGSRELELVDDLIIKIPLHYWILI